MKEEKIVIGKIFGVHGIKGELKVYPLTDDINRFKDLNYCLIKDSKFEIEAVRFHQGVVLLKLKEINDRNESEKLKNVFIEIFRKDAVPLEEGEYFIEDLKGLTLINEKDEEVGVLVDVLTFGPVEIYEFKVGEKQVLLPDAEGNIIEINLEKNIIKANLKMGVVN